MRSKMKWEQHGSCVMCGNPVFARGLNTEPEVRRTCFCVAAIPQAVSVPSVWIEPEHRADCAIVIARTGRWSIVAPSCTCGAVSTITTTTTVTSSPTETLLTDNPPNTRLRIPPLWTMIPGLK